MAPPSLLPDLKAFEQFLSTIGKATNETQKREAFIILAATGFGDTQLATELALSAEYRVKFQAHGLLRRGAIDAFYGNLVIEFENDLSKTRNHALEQLCNYVAGAWAEDGSTARPYLAVAADGTRWEIFLPRLADASLPGHADNIVLDPLETWNADSDQPASSLRQFLNRLFYRKTLLKPTALHFAQDFGLTSPAFLRAQALLAAKLSELGDDSQLKVYRKAWSDSLQISYGAVETDDQLFAKHTYLAVLARLLVWASLERRPLAPHELDDVLEGIYFQGRHIANLVEDDFFRWHTIPSSTDAHAIWVGLSRHLAGYDLAAVTEDILKPLYEQLVDPTTRRVLGEFYTPDWLATSVVNELLEQWNWKKQGPPHVLDPACGSGTFLRAVLDLVRTRRDQLPPEQLLDEILSRITGIDVHPLAVIISRATYLLAIKDLVPAATRSITLPVFLANSLRMPELQRQLKLGGDLVALEVSGKKYSVPMELVNHGADYDAAIDDVLNVARAYGKSTAPLEQAALSLVAVVGSRLDKYDPSGGLVKVLGSMAQHIARLVRERADTVHGFLLKNHYRPSMLRHTFDFVIGNPPWLTVGAIGTQAYKDLVVGLSVRYKLTSRRTGAQSNTELATVFLAQAVAEFLDPDSTISGARVALVMPRSLFTANHHAYIRQGLYRVPFNVSALWDLEKVAPLFNIPACVLFVERAKPLPEAPRPGKLVRGKLPRKDMPLSGALPHLVFETVQFNLAFLGRRSTWRVGAATGPAQSAIAYYSTRFRQGAILYPQTLVVVTPTGPLTKKTNVRVVTDKDAIATAKKATVSVNHLVETANLFCTAAADHILPFTLAPHLWTVVLPTLGVPGEANFRTADANALRLAGRINTAGWLEWAERQWKKLRKASEKTSLHQRLDYLSQLSAQAKQLRFVIIFIAAGKRPVACTIDTTDLAIPFVARDRTFWASFGSFQEPFYLAALFNSDYGAAAIVDWMNKGQFGLRDMNKRILDVPWPRFDSKNDSHTRLADLSRELSEQASQLVKALPPADTGRRRAMLRGLLNAAKRAQVETLVSKVMKP